ncbi:Uncharacterised protein [Nocardia brasiliensis]|nr:Uncharacterised protein [Nocardia brasiliensis]
MQTTASGTANRRSRSQTNRRYRSPTFGDPGVHAVVCTVHSVTLRPVVGEEDARTVVPHRGRSVALEPTRPPPHARDACAGSPGKPPPFRGAGPRTCESCPSYASEDGWVAQAPGWPLVRPTLAIVGCPCCALSTRLLRDGTNIVSGGRDLIGSCREARHCLVRLSRCDADEFDSRTPKSSISDPIAIVGGVAIHTETHHAAALDSIGKFWAQGNSPPTRMARVLVAVARIVAGVDFPLIFRRNTRPFRTGR